MNCIFKCYNGCVNNFVLRIANWYNLVKDNNKNNFLEFLNLFVGTNFVLRDETNQFYLLVCVVIIFLVVIFFCRLTNKCNFNLFLFWGGIS
jgi:hypothetical protein